MSWSATMMRYLSTRVLWAIAIAVALFAALIFMIDAVETVRQHAARDTVGFGLALKMSLLKLPGLIQQFFPFVFLFGAMWAFATLTRNNELVIARAAGISVWQFLAPAAGLALVVGLLAIALFNPFAAMTSSQFRDLEARYIHGETGRLAVSSTGLWLRQPDAGSQSVVHAQKAVPAADGGLHLEEVIIFVYDSDNVFATRIDAESAILEEPFWLLEDAWISRMEPVARTEFHETFRLETSLTRERIQDSFARPDTLSFWRLPGFIDLAERAGFSALPHKIYWYSLLTTPLMLMAMVFIAATFSLRFSRLGGTSWLIAAGVITGFILFFLDDVAKTLGESGVVPPLLAALSPASVALLAGISLLLYFEDG